MTLRKTATRPRQRWALLVAVVVGLLLGVASISLAVHDIGEFELDKDAANNTTYSHIGDLGSNVNATTTAIPVCQFSATNPANGSVILIEAERMTINSVVAGSFGGNCSPAVKRQYNVTRAASPNAVAHAKGDVKGFISLVSPYTPSPADGPDWNQVHASVFADNNNEGDDDKCIALGLVECTFVSDQIGPSTFTGGGSKDYIDIPSWQHTTGGSPDKGEILNAFAAKAVDDNPDEDQIVYFGMDRWAVDGSTDIGFWFFKGQVVACPSTEVPAEVCEGVPNGQFAGEHQLGDILALATFTQGGADTTIRVFEWVGSGGNESGTVDGPRADSEDCIQDPPLVDDDLCGTVNNTTIDVPWDYQFKGATVAKWIPAGGMFEGGINLSALDLEGCFSSFLAETRSSPSITAILKDFALGQFEACDTELTTTPKTGAGAALTPDSDNDNLDEISIGTGSVTVTDSAALEVKGTTDFTGTLDFYLCGPITNPTGCSASGVNVGAASGVNPVTENGSYSSATATLTSVGRYCWYATFTSGTEGVPDADDGTIESAGPPKSTGECFEVTPVTPQLDTDAGNGPVDFGQPVTDTATLTGTANQPGSRPTGVFPTINPTVPGAAAGGTITFKLYGPFTDGTPDPTECASLGLAAGFATANPNGIQRAVSGDNTYPTASQAAVSFTPQAPGWYFWKAQYGGNSPNTLQSAEHNADCSDTDEAVQVRQIPTEIKTRQSWFPNDQATITSSVVGDNLGTNGTVDFTLYNSATCSGTVVYTERKTLTGGAHSEQVATSNYTGSTGVTPGGATVTPFSITTDYPDGAGSSKGPFSWKVVYTPAAGDTAHTGKQSSCTTGSTESFSITYTNDAGPGTNLP